MSEPAFTPGEWEARDGAVGIKESGWGVGYPPSAGTIASLYDGEYIENPNASMDAALIASAPDLYAAAQAAADHMVGTFSEGGTVHKQLLAALAKARGEA